MDTISQAKAMPKIVVPDVTDQDKEELVAYNKAHYRLKVLSKRVFQNYTEDQRAADKLIMFTASKRAKKTNRTIFEALLSDLMVEAELLYLENSLRRWQIISSDLVATKIKLYRWSTYLNVAESMYSVEEENPYAGNFYLNTYHYKVDDIPLLRTCAGWYIKNGSKLKTMSEKLDHSFAAGYLLSNNRTVAIIRPRSANSHDIKFMEKLIGFYQTNGETGSYGLRNDISNTLRRFVKNYNWPNKQALVKLL